MLFSLLLIFEGLCPRTDRRFDHFRLPTSVVTLCCVLRMCYWYHCYACQFAIFTGPIGSCLFAEYFRPHVLSVVKTVARNLPLVPKSEALLSTFPPSLPHQPFSSRASVRQCKTTARREKQHSYAEARYCLAVSVAFSSNFFPFSPMIFQKNLLFQSTLSRYHEVRNYQP